VWFRRDLRLEDNPAWSDASRDGAVAALYVIDPVPWATAGAHRRDLLLGHLQALHRSLVDLGGSLLVLHGRPEQVVGEVVTRLGAGRVVANRDVTAYARRRDAAVLAALDGTPLEDHWGNHVHPPGTIRAEGAQHVHQVFTPFHRAWSGRAIEAWPAPGDAEVLDAVAVLGAGPPPAPTATPVMAPGEDAAHERLAAWTEEVDTYDARRDRPDDPTGTSRLSADLRWGTLDPRRVVEVVGTATPGRAAFVRQLAWRDWYAHLVAERPELTRRALRPYMDALAWRHDPQGLAAWRAGRTGYPIVDAGMRELAATGWMHNRVRMIVASFLTKDLLVDWREGEAHFRELLVDAEPTQNAGNWQWVAGTGADAAPYFRVFNPLTQARRFDPDGTYTRRWVPELAGLTAPGIHAPWELGPLELAAAGVVLGEDYPWPIVEHPAARERALEAYRVARAARDDEHLGGSRSEG
jgi:deoxyribodipyrimidine photo-lyase